MTVVTRSTGNDDFWISSGHRFADRGPDGRLLVGDDVLRLWLARPELLPPPDACVPERALHARLLADPALPLEPGWLETLADEDARENWSVFLAFRDRLIAAGTLEAAYLDLIRRPAHLPALFLDQMVHVILRNALDGETDPQVLRAGELLFRSARAVRRDGRLMLADAERLGAPADAHESPISALFQDAEVRAMPLLGPDTAEGYRARSDAYDLLLDFEAGGPGPKAFARVLEHWLRHLLHLGTRIRPLGEWPGEMAWFVGLDAEGTRIGNAAWRTGIVPLEGADRILALFDLSFDDPGMVAPGMAGRGTTLILAAGADGSVKVKPQNLLTGLPLAESAARA